MRNWAAKIKAAQMLNHCNVSWHQIDTINIKPANWQGHQNEGGKGIQSNDREHKVGSECQRVVHAHATSTKVSSRRRGTWDGKSIIHPRNLWVRGSNLTGGHNRLSCPRLADKALNPYPTKVSCINCNEEWVAEADNHLQSIVDLRTAHMQLQTTLPCRLYVCVGS